MPHSAVDKTDPAVPTMADILPPKLAELLADGSVSEIMINGWDRVFVEREGRIRQAELTFRNDDEVVRLARQIAKLAGKEISPRMPILDARMRDGSRANIILPPLAVTGPSITIRKFSPTPFTIRDLISRGTVTRQVADFFEICVKNRKNIVISGGTSTGKTTLLNVLSSIIPAGDRIITIEDAAELRLHQDNVVALEARPAYPHLGEEEVTIRQLVKNALRMRPDRIVIGECRGGEVLDMLIAMNTGLEGSMTTAHANSPRDLLSKLETMALMSGMEIPARALRDQIASAIDVIVHLTRFPAGQRRVTHVVEVTGLESNRITIMDIFHFRTRGRESDGRIVGELVPTEMIPSFIGRLIRSGRTIPMSIFHSTGH